MKTVIIFLSISLLAIISCTKKNTDISGIPAPIPVKFVIVNPEGRSMIHSKNDVVSITYMDNGVEKSLTNTLNKIQMSSTDTTTTKKYNGIGVGCDMSGLSMRKTNPVKTFYLSLNGVRLGTIYYDYVNYVQKSFTFNNENVLMDTSVYPGVNVVNIK